MLALLALVALQADPLEPAWHGRWQCFSPNEGAHTCFALATYTSEGGRLFNPAQILVSSNPSIVITITEEVYREGDAVCSRTFPDYSNATFQIDGAPASPEAQATLRQEYTPPPYSGPPRHDCVTLHPEADGRFMIEVTADGVRDPSGDFVIRWVDPAEGWRVAP